MFPMTTQPAAGPLVLRLIALVLTALYRRGFQHVAEPRREGAGGEIVVVHLHVNAKLIHQVIQIREVVTEALASVGIVATPSLNRATALDVSASLEALQAPPSPEAVAALLQGALRAKMKGDGYPEVETMRVTGISSEKGGAIYVTGGSDERDEAANAKAVRWCKAWLAKHFPEFTVEEGADPVTRLPVWHVGHGIVRRALRLTAGAAAVLAMRAA
jgi:hypothetical protein